MIDIVCKSAASALSLTMAAYKLRINCMRHACKLLCACIPQIFAGLLVGAMLPYWFSAMTMKSVGKAALAMVEEVRRQFNTIPGLMEGTARPDYRRCVEISTAVSASCWPFFLLQLCRLWKDGHDDSLASCMQHLGGPCQRLTTFQYFQLCEGSCQRKCFCLLCIVMIGPELRFSWEIGINQHSNASPCILCRRPYRR